MLETIAETTPTTSTPTASTPSASTAPDATTAPDAASITWVVVKNYGPPPVRQPGGLATEFLFRTRGEITAITAQSNAIGRAGVQQKVREALDPAEQAIARYLLLQKEVGVLDLETRRVAAKLATAQAQRAEFLLEAMPGFAHEVARMDVIIAPLQSQASALASASTAIAETVGKARAEAIVTITAIDATVHSREFSGLRRRREAVIATLPALLSATLTELAILERGALVATAASSAIAIEALLDELAAAPPAVPSEPSAPPERADGPPVIPTPEPSAVTAPPLEPSVLSVTPPRAGKGKARAVDQEVEATNP
jgi:hypothetical protein